MLARDKLNFSNKQLHLAEQTIAEEHLQRLRNEHAVILNAVGEGVQLLDRNGRIIFENGAANVMLGYKSTELLGRLAHEAMHYSSKDGIPYPHDQCPILASIKDGKTRRESNEVFWRRDGSSFPVEYTCSPVFDERGAPNGTVVLFSDITGRLRTADQLAQSQKMAAVGQLAAGVAHEINNPLGVILGFAQGLSRRAKPGDLTEIPIKSIEREALRCKALVQDLLNFSRIGDQDQVKQDLNLTLDSAFPLIETRAKMSQINFIRNLANDLPRILLNKGHMQQIIVNLCNNAIDAMDEGGTLIVTTKLEQHNDLTFVCLTVADNGRGMSKAIKDKIFDPFFTTKSVGEGTGLGLSLVYEYVKKHLGTIEVESEVGQTEFKVRLPIFESQEVDRIGQDSDIQFKRAV